MSENCSSWDSWNSLVELKRSAKRVKQGMPIFSKGERHRGGLGRAGREGERGRDFV